MTPRLEHRLRAWVVAADMGFGHQRAAHALRPLAEGDILTVGNAATTDDFYEITLWKLVMGSYEMLSRIQGVPFVGGPLFSVVDSLLHIPPFYPFRDLSHPSPSNHIVDFFIRRGLGRTLLERMRSNPLPLPMVSTFYAPALIADHADMENIYSVICDSEESLERAHQEVGSPWVGQNLSPYLASTDRKTGPVIARSKTLDATLTPSNVQPG